MQRQWQLILVADGDHDARVILGAQLRHAGYRAIDAADGERALSLARRRRPTLIIAELYLAAAGERCLVRALKRDRDLAGIPVLVYTARIGAVDEEWALDAGCDGFITKPSHRADLMSEVGLLASAPTREREDKRAASAS
jgi:CheY-like chemotaxis protein